MPLLVSAALVSVRFLVALESAGVSLAAVTLTVKVLLFVSPPASVTVSVKASLVSLSRALTAAALATNSYAPLVLFRYSVP